MTVGGETPVEASPTTTVETRNPDTTISKDRRVVSDLRRINPRFPDPMYYPIHVPAAYDIARLTTTPHAKYPEYQVVLTKRDVSWAPRLLRLRPALSVLMAVEIPDKFFGFAAFVAVLLYLAIPFGRHWRPVRFPVFGEAVTASGNALYFPGTGSGADIPCASRRCVDDGVLIDVNMHNRMQVATTIWKRFAGGLLVPKSASLGKLGE